MSRVTVFLSHSSKDIQKVRQIRDILEALDYEPLLFYLKCLDDDNENLESFIQREIEARNIFIYCKSENSEKSKWVQKELDYIKSFDSKRLFTIDISLPFRNTLVQLLQSITEILRKNRVYISCSRNAPDAAFGDAIQEFLEEQNFDVVRYRDVNYLKNVVRDGEHIRALTEAHTFIPVISRNSLKSYYCTSELEYVVHRYESDPASFTEQVIPVCYGIGASVAMQRVPGGEWLSGFEFLEIPERVELSAKEKEKLLQLLHR
jgi:hypothetical protein